METIFFQLAEQLTPGEIAQVCSINTQLQQLCENEDLWQSLYLRRFGSLSESSLTPTSWKYEYAIRNAHQKLFEIKQGTTVYSLILPSDLPAIKTVAFSPQSHLKWLLTWDGKVYEMVNNIDNFEKLIIDYRFKISPLFPFPVDQLVTTDKSVLAVDKQGQAYISRDIFGDAILAPIPLPELKGSPQLVEKIWVIFDSRGTGDYYLLSKNDQMYLYQYQQFIHVPELSNQGIVELGNTYGLIIAITPTRNFVYSPNYSHNLSINLTEPIIMAENRIILARDHQTYWINNFFRPDASKAWLKNNISIRKIAGDFALSYSGELYHHHNLEDEIEKRKSDFLFPIPTAKLGNHQIVDIFGIDRGINQLIILATLPIPVTQKVYQKLMQNNQIEESWVNEAGRLMARDVRGNLIIV